MKANFFHLMVVTGFLVPAAAAAQTGGNASRVETRLNELQRSVNDLSARVEQLKTSDQQLRQRLEKFQTRFESRLERLEKRNAAPKSPPGKPRP